MQYSERESAAAVLGWAARGQALAAKGLRTEAADWMVANGAPSSAVRIVKAPVGASDMGDLAGVSITQWADSARTTSAFYRILADGAFVRAPINARIAITTIPASGTAVGEGAVVPLSAATITSVSLVPTKVVSLIVVSDLMLRDTSPGGQTSFNRALLGAVSEQADAAFIARLIADAGAFTVASSGPLASNAKNDLRTCLLNVNSSSRGKLYWIAGVNTAKRASTLATTTGADAFAAMSATGGELANLPCIVSSGIAADSLVLIDASGIAVDGGSPPTVTASTEADVIMDSAPVVGAAALVTSMFQLNMTALKASAMFGVQPLRDDCVAQITNITWAAA